MERKLTKTERAELKFHHANGNDGKTRDRIKAVLLSDDGYSYSEIARILLIDDETVRRHIKNYFKWNKLKPENGGSQSLLNEIETKELIRHLERVTYLHVKQIRAYVKKRFKKYYSLSGMLKWLKRNRFRYKKPHAVPSRVNLEAQEEFKVRYEELKEKAGENEFIYHLDSVHPQHQTRLSYGWIKSGEKRAIQTSAKQLRLNITGAYCLRTQRFIYSEEIKIDALSVIRFLTKLRSHHRSEEKIHVILDNAGYHRNGKVLESAKKLNIELHFLPAYSPNLNPIERMWKIFHEHVTYNKYYEKFCEFREASLNFFRHIWKKKKILRSRITDNFQILIKPNFAS